MRVARWGFAVGKEREFRRSAHITRPPNEVWTFMTNPANAGRWIQGVTESKLITPPPMQAGSRLRETRTLGRYTETFEIDIRVFEPPSRYGASVKAGKAEFVYEFNLKDAGGSTDIDVVARATGKGILTGMFLGVAFHMMEKYDGDQLDRLKAALEGDSPLAAP